MKTVVQSKKEQKSLALWAANCAERALPFFEKMHPEDDRPRKAIAVCRGWARGKTPFSMSLVRGVSLAAHASARATDNLSARAAARAAGQAVGTLHVGEHACAAASYAAAAIAYNAGSDAAPAAYAKERAWQMRRFPKCLRKNRKLMSRIWKGLT